MPYLLPIFPLPEAILFPRTHLRLHVFEPRYVALVESAMAGDRKLGLAQLREGYEPEYFGAPPIHRIVTAARILIADHLADGRWNILVEGIERAVIEKEIQSSPFRIAAVESLTEDIRPEQRNLCRSLMAQVATIAEQIAQFLPIDRRLLTNLVNTHQHPGIVADVVASALVADAYARQSLLAETDVLRRLQLLMVQLRQVGRQLQQNGLPLDLPAVD